MAFTQVAFDMPSELSESLKAGKSMLSLIARDSKTGRIIKHYPVTSIWHGNHIIQFAKTHKKELGISAAIGILVSLSTLVPMIKKNSKKRKKQKELDNYLHSISTKTLTLDAINELDELIKSLISDTDGDIQFQMNPEQLNQFMNALRVYTISLAKANSVEIDPDDLPSDGTSIIDFCSYLDAQRKIIESAR